MTDAVRGRGPWLVFAIALVVSGLATAASWLLPESIVATAVGGVFLGATWVLVLRRRDADVRGFGLSLGGMLEVPPSPWNRTVRAAAVALGWAVLLGLLVFPAYVTLFARWWHPPRLGWALPPKAWDAILGQLVVVALPEEAFFRGYLQTAFDRVWTGRIDVLGAKVGLGLVVSSAIFAVGHFATIPNPARFAVFVPSLLFGWLRARTGGVGAGIAFHAMCNLLSEGLARGSGLMPAGL